MDGQRQRLEFGSCHLSEADAVRGHGLQVEEAELRIHVLEAEEERLVRELDLMTNMVKELEGQLTRAGVVRSEALAEAQEREDALLRRLDKAAKRLAAAEELAEAADQAAEEARLKSQEHERFWRRQNHVSRATIAFRTSCSSFLSPRTFFLCCCPTPNTSFFAWAPLQLPSCCPLILEAASDRTLDAHSPFTCFPVVFQMLPTHKDSNA